MRVARIASAHEYVHYVVNMNLSFLERQIPLDREGPRQIRMTAVVVFRPLQSSITGWYRGRSSRRRRRARGAGAHRCSAQAARVERRRGPRGGDPRMTKPRDPEAVPVASSTRKIGV